MMPTMQQVLIQKQLKWLDF